MALIFITHDLSLIGQICDDLMILYRGKVAEFGPAIAILDHPRHPYTQQLMAAVPVPDARSRPAELPARLMNSLAVVDEGPKCSFEPRCIYAVDICRSVVPAARSIDKTEVACHRAQELEKSATSKEI
jgi:peptide/nickel transport system ATP-binding protein